MSVSAGRTDQINQSTGILDETVIENQPNVKNSYPVGNLSETLSETLKTVRQRGFFCLGYRRILIP